MKGLVIKSLVLTILFIGGLYGLKYFLKFSVSSIFHLPYQKQSISYSLEGSEIDTNIVLINIGHLDRGTIAETIHLISKAEPGVIAFNICFDKNKKTPFDAQLYSTIQKEDNLVFLHSNECGKYSRKAYYGKEEYVVHEDGTVRKFLTDSSALSSIIVRLYNKRLYEELKQRQTREELINYIGNYTHFLTLNAELVNTGMIDPVIFKDKIVLIGYLGSQLPDAVHDKEDTFSTPVGDPHAARMYSTEISANVLHTIIQQKYITIIPLIFCFGIYLIVLIFNSILGFLALRISRKLFAFTLCILVLAESLIAGFLMIFLSESGIILDIEDLPFIILGGFLIQYFLLKYPLFTSSSQKA